jgi:hypothetical protein
MQDWNSYRAALLENVGKFGEQNPEVMRGLNAVDGAARKKEPWNPRFTS